MNFPSFDPSGPSPLHGKKHLLCTNELCRCLRSALAALQAVRLRQASFFCGVVCCTTTAAPLPPLATCFRCCTAVYSAAALRRDWRFLSVVHCRAPRFLLSVSLRLPDRRQLFASMSNTSSWAPRDYTTARRRSLATSLNVLLRFLGRRWRRSPPHSPSRRPSPTCSPRGRA